MTPVSRGILGMGRDGVLRRAFASAFPPKYMLDTNICIYIAEGLPGKWERIEENLALCRPGEAVISAVTLAELRQGVGSAKDEEIRKFRATELSAFLQGIPVLPFDSAAANCCERLGPFIRQRGRENDKLIAAHALCLGLTLVTNDLRHFHHYPGLRMENWV